MIALDDFQAITRKVNALKRQRDKAVGAKEELLRRLAKEFGCKTRLAAERLLEKYKTRELTAYKRYVRCRKRFDKKWAKKLKGI